MHVKVNQTGTYEMKRYWYNPGNDYYTYTTTYTITFNTTSDNMTVYGSGWGNDDPGHWPAGQYKWEYYYDDWLIYTKYFTIKGSSYASGSPKRSPRDLEWKGRHRSPDYIITRWK